jgi:uncharacterized membrane protein YczE
LLELKTKQMKVMEIQITVIVGWVILISSWIIPSFIEDLFKKRLVGLLLTTLATGIFIGHLLTIIF